MKTSMKGLKMSYKKAIFLVVLTLLIVMFSFDNGYAVVTYLDTDTIKVVDAYGEPGDTNVIVNFYFANTVHIAGWSIRVVFDTSLIRPTHDNLGKLNAELVGRGTIFSSEMNGGSEPKPGIVTFFGANDPIAPFVTMPPGSGNILQIEFKINSYVTTSTDAFIHLESVPFPESWNNFSSTVGDTIYIPILEDGYIHISGGPGPGNDAPVFGPLASQYEMTEGDSLGFLVSASDPDGDSLSLYAESSLPANASFPSTEGDSAVSQWFVFKPNYTQGPAVFEVTFAAEDTVGAITRRTVTITLNDFQVSGDLLSVSTDQGGIPGAAGRMVDVGLNSENDIYGVQFDLSWDPNIIQIDSFVKTTRTANFSLRTNLSYIGSDSGTVRVLLFGLENQIIPAGTGPILSFSVSVDSASECGVDVPLTLSEAKEAVTIGGASQPMPTSDGLFYVDCFGDVNSDGSIDVADVVDLVAYILGTLSFDARKLEAADVNHDSTVDVGDLVGTYNIILGLPIEGAPLGGFTAPLASVELDLEDLSKGLGGEARVWADLSVPVAGAQFEIEYDPDQFSFSAPVLTERSDGFIIQYRDDKNGKLKAIIYSPAGDAIQTGKGDILRLPVEVKSGVSEELEIDLTDVVMANSGAVVIPVSGYSTLPKMFSLSQNYPNPFNPQTTIQYEIGGDDGSMPVRATLKIYNILGQRVKTLLDEDVPPGIYRVVWDGRDENGERVASGGYLYRFTTDEYSETKKMVMMK